MFLDEKKRKNVLRLCSERIKTKSEKTSRLLRILQRWELPHFYNIYTAKRNTTGMWPKFITFNFNCFYTFAHDQMRYLFNRGKFRAKNLFFRPSTHIPNVKQFAVSL